MSTVTVLMGAQRRVLLVPQVHTGQRVPETGNPSLPPVHSSPARKAWQHQHVSSRELWEGVGNVRSFLEGERGERVQESTVSLPRKMDSAAFSAGAVEAGRPQATFSMSAQRRDP